MLETAPSFVLYSLNPSPFVQEKEAFHGFGVRGKMRVTDSGERAGLLAALRRGPPLTARWTGRAFAAPSLKENFFATFS